MIASEPNHHKDGFLLLLAQTNKLTPGRWPDKDSHKKYFNGIPEYLTVLNQTIQCGKLNHGCGWLLVDFQLVQLGVEFRFSFGYFLRFIMKGNVREFF